MNKRPEDWKGTLRQAAETAADTARSAAWAVGLGAERLKEAARRQMETARLRRETDAALRELGALLYATHTGSPTDSDVLLEKMTEIDGLRARLRALEGEPVIHLLCPCCGREVSREDVYCPDCGEKL